MTWTGGGDGTSWNSAANWGGTLPGASDDVSNPAGFNVVHSTGTDSIKSLQSASALTLSGGTLTVGTALMPGRVEVDNTFTLSGGTLADADVQPGSGGQGLTMTENGGTLDGVTADTNLDLTGYYANATVKDNLTLNGTATLGDLGGGNLVTLNFVGSQTLDGNGTVLFNNTSTNRLYVSADASQTAATLIIVRTMTIHGLTGNVDGQPTSTIVNQGRILADTATGVISIQPSGGTFTNQGTLAALRDGILAVDSPRFSVDGSAGAALSSPGSSVVINHDLLGSTTNSGGFSPLGTTLFNGSGTAAAPQSLEAMSDDLGPVAAGFNANFAYGSLTLGNNTYLKLVDLSHNSTGTTPEAVYANALTVPSGTTLNLNGLHLYVRSATVSGTVVGGSIIILPSVVAQCGFTVAAAAGTGFTAQTVATFTDPAGVEPLADYSATVNWGDGHTSAGTVNGPDDGGAFTVSGANTYASVGNYTINVAIGDDGGSATTAVSAANVTATAAPTVTLSGSAVAISGVEGAALANVAVATFTAVNGPTVANAFAASIDWGRWHWPPPER